jgi:hypothetical protein
MKDFESNVLKSSEWGDLEPEAPNNEAEFIEITSS